MANNSVMQNIIAALDTTPIGAVSYFAMVTAPDGFLICDGSLVNRTTYSELFSKIGSVFGAGDGSTTFQLPDLRGEFIRGLDLSRGVDDGRIIGSPQLDALQEHVHRVPSRSSGAGTQTGDGYIHGTAFDTAKTAGVLNTPARVASETRPRNVALLPCIKYKMCSYYYNNSKTIFDTYISNPTANSGDILVDKNNANTYVKDTSWVRTSTPAGVMVYNYSNTVPAGWLKVNPLVVYSQATYPELATAIGVAAGATWSFVDTRGEFIRVWDDGRNIDMGRTIRSAQVGTSIPNMSVYASSSSSGILVTPSLSAYNSYPDSNALDGSYDSIDQVASNTYMSTPLTPNGGTSTGKYFRTRPRNLAFPLLIKV